MKTKGQPQNRCVTPPKRTIATELVCLLCEDAMVGSLVFLFSSFLFWDSFIFMEKLEKSYRELQYILYPASSNVDILLS